MNFLAKAIRSANSYVKSGITLVHHGVNIWVANFNETGTYIPEVKDSLDKDKKPNGRKNVSFKTINAKGKLATIASQVKEGSANELTNGACLAVAVLEDNSLANFMADKNKTIEDVDVQAIKMFLENKGLGKSKDTRMVAPILKDLIRENEATKGVVDNYVTALQIAVDDGQTINKARQIAESYARKESGATRQLNEPAIHSGKIEKALVQLLTLMASENDGAQALAEIQAFALHDIVVANNLASTLLDVTHAQQSA